MTHDFSRRAFLAGLLATTSTQVWGDAPATSLRPLPRPDGARIIAAPAAQRLIDAANLGSARVGYAVADARTGEMLEVMNPLLQLPPASVTKALTALYALDSLGESYQFSTQLIATGGIENGRVNGDLILVGGGDPTLSTDALGDLARTMRDAGIREVRGALKVHSGALPYVHHIDNAQPDHVSYNPSVSGLNLNFNRVHFEWRRASGSYQITMDARAERYRPEVSTAEMRVVNRSAPVYTYDSNRDIDQWTVARGALGNAGSRWLPVRNPEHYASDVFRTLARSFGIVLDPPVFVSRLPQGQVIASHTSVGLPRVLRDMLKYSVNLTAEAVGLKSSAQRGRVPRNLQGSAQNMSQWLRNHYGARRARLVDHSGLGERNQITARDMVHILNQAGADGPLRPLLKTIKLRDAQGRELRDQDIDIKAKTGTLNFVSALSGYARGPDGRDLSFAIFCADTDRRAAIARSDRERPQGARSWNRRAKRLQQQLIERWTALYEQ
ncbi:D-alanyl-D-alanine carboxypeptidase/D-alanyl-D-alanine endopeptidase [Cochlodiniinecator piscidefendens]|uniref:D-alanyl-D-alanine carboxypeptidase/D-alanyl-D-alanine endopeptidase n=1 Tax=Cochlodiniinecator piscidefendens TaxID=2715756 RepID=UPI001407ABCF|nr:D-alanyl-D-alanine carboxypeptidase/D-alanyl-D-alanine-endopeptidase [Cochlodiniinecator piscidefendens]